MSQSKRSPHAKKQHGSKKRHHRILSWVGMLAVIAVILVGRLLLEGILSNPLADPCTFKSRGYEDIGSVFYAPLMRLKFHSSYPKNKVLVLPLTEGEEAGDVPASAIENPCEGRRFMAGLVDRLSAYGPSVIAIDRYYNDDDRCPESSGANDALRVALSSVPQNQGQYPVTAVVVGLDSGKATQEKEKSTGGNCLIEKRALPLKANQIPAGRVARTVHMGLARMNSDVLRIPLRWWLTPSTEEPSHEDRPVNGFALAAYTQAAIPMSAEERAKADEEIPLSRYPAGLASLLRHDEHPYASFPKDPPPEVSPADLLCADKDGLDFVRRYLLGIHEPQATIPADAGHPEQAYCNGAKALPNLAGKVVVIGVRQEDVDVHDFPGGERYGVDLQAEYIDALLDNRYMKTAPAWLDWGLTILLCVLLLGLEVMPEYTTAKWWVGVIWDVGAIVGVMVLSILSLEAGYFTPVFWLACSGVVLTDIVTRLFERMTHHVREHRGKHHEA
jgi:hypothetical protein